jgi:hypothetical protein
MIELTEYVSEDGTKFRTWKLLKPDERIGGVGVHYVFLGSPFIREMVNELRLKKVGYRAVFDADLYAESRWSFIPQKLFLLRRRYLRIIWFLYDHARLFQPIPHRVMFSWGYFTPVYAAIKATEKLKKGVRRCLSMLRSAAASVRIRS